VSGVSGYHGGIISLKLRAASTKAAMATPFAQNPLPIYVTAPGLPGLPPLPGRMLLFKAHAAM
jgi:hypothetical protein